MPHRFSKNGELLVAYEDTNLKGQIRRASITSQELAIAENSNAHIKRR